MAAMKIIYLGVAELNVKWSYGVIKKFCKSKIEITETIKKRYRLSHT